MKTNNKFDKLINRIDKFIWLVITILISIVVLNSITSCTGGNHTKQVDKELKIIEWDKSILLEKFKIKYKILKDKFDNNKINNHIYHATLDVIARNTNQALDELYRKKDSLLVISQ